MAHDAGRFLDDTESLRAIIQLMSPGERILYDSFGALTVEAAFPSRRMVVYTLRGGVPCDIVILTLGDLELVWPECPKITVSDSAGDITVGVVPTQWRGRDLFIHVPQTFQLKYKGKRTAGGDVQFVPHYAVLIKTRSKEHLQVEGHTYCVTLNKFRERFPQTPLRY